GARAGRDRRGAEADRGRDVGDLQLVRQADRPGAPGGPAVGDAVHRRRAAAGAMSSTPRIPDVRVGSATDGLTPFSVAERSLAARAPHWLSLAAVALAAVCADQVTKALVSSSLS